ncbi:glycosyltransferase family 4 protein [Gluconobacter kanchanaburiensis]|uniref:Glycosyl transferase family 1 n=1 Tax=Gluconobacter kanchanaburiensis NBRC 103587 TaxID=1307948 RepID=A0A511B971_9PROT|nr:glycosyltransferase family 4 protein [Gluconobacter kanchanaburiensis]MBF0862660.1 glycosyltransferase family 4 protein [Gluconobacter kanchanaburiensis]GBR67538.1 glycosyltransferase [Gluconobacter kanchanaburiensis NBRC 103587]GEK96968.1 glycosyl transferase family 1 [Gluconobacter kanchanaburiensis NBRC 103587]
MKILEITNVDFALRQFLLPLMRDLRDAGHEVQGACAEGTHLEPVRAEGFTVHGVPMARSLSPVAQYRAFMALVRLIRKEKPDLVHGHMPISGILARFAARVCGVRVVAYTCHGFLFNQPGSWNRRTLSLVLEWAAGRITDLYMTVSSEEARDARRLHLNRIPIAIGNGRNPEHYRPSPETRARLRAELGVPETRPVVIVVSRLVRHKGHPELLRAMEDVPDAELWVVGERLPSDHGADMTAAFARATERLGSRLRLLGYRDDVAELLTAADIFALPSHFEGLPMSVIEAMLTGLPVVAANVRGPREQVVDGKTGFLVPPGLSAPLARALCRLTQDRALREEMGCSGRKIAVESYDERRILRRVVALMEESFRRISS